MLFRSGRCRWAQLAIIRQMSGQMLRGSAGEYQADTRCPRGERPLVELSLEPGVFSERRTEKLPLRVDFIHRVEFGVLLCNTFTVSLSQEYSEDCLTDAVDHKLVHVMYFKNVSFLIIYVRAL